VEIIKAIVNPPEIGAIYTGKVTRLMSFGAFVELAPEKEGLVHISQWDVTRVESMEAVTKEGDIVQVKVTEIDDQGRINLSRKAVIDPTADTTVRRPPPRPGGGRGGDRGGRPGGGDRRPRS
jgi:polyribonucleotide nucleotidyltransferase